MRHGGTASRGFTLLEVLVTVAIFALLFAVLMGGWFQAQIAQSRLGEAAQQVQQQQQLSLVLRQMLAEVQSPKPGRGTSFAGTRRGFIAETSASGAPGLGSALLSTSLQIEGQAPALRLRLQHPGLEGAGFPWRLLQAELRYFDANGRANESWPPVASLVDGATGPASALPALLQFTWQFEGQLRPTSILVAPRATPWALSEPVSPFGGGQPE